MRQTLLDFHQNLNEQEKGSITEKLLKKVSELSEYKNAEIIFAYIPDRLEADCMPVIQDALKNGKKVCVPKVDFESSKSGKNEMDFYFLDSSRPIEDQLETGTYGIREPKAGLEIFRGVAGYSSGTACGDRLFKNTFIFVLVPGVAFTKDGKRLGHGKGFYDIYIERFKQEGIKPFLCGFCLPCQIVDEIPTDEHDVLMDEVVTVN